jgi:putative FmdB family regulatory protein
LKDPVDAPIQRVETNQQRISMPIYAFDCSACGHDFERLQKISDSDPLVCPVCGRETVKRRLSAPSFRLAGSGWYETDFKTDKDKKRNLADGGDAGKSGAGETARSPDAAKPAGDSAASPKPAAAPVTTTSSTTATSSSSSSSD